MMTRWHISGLTLRSLLMSLAAVAVFVLITPPAALTQQRMVIGGDDVPAVDANGRAAIVDSLCAALQEIYVFPDVAERMEKLLRKQLKDKAYDQYTDLIGFTDQLTRDMRSVSNDRHLGIRALSPQDLEEQQTLTDEELVALQLQRGRERNFGFDRVERLPGNIGYLQFNEFSDATFGGATAVAALNFLANCDALIIDLRANGGGEPNMIQLMSSYFFDEPTHLNSFYIRREDTTQQFWTQAHVTGPRMTEIPIYVLTAHYTFSAAEEFTYNLKNLERATIIGETTGGGAHPVTSKRFADLKVAVHVPYGRAINPVTGTNWEGTGVEPHISVPADSALLVAQIEAMKTIIEKTTDDRQKAILSWALTGLEVLRSPVVLTEDQLQACVGVYGPRTITLENGDLYYERENRPKFRLIPMGNDMFMLGDLQYFRIQFVRDDNGTVTTLVGLYDNGTSDPSPRTDK